MNPYESSAKEAYTRYIDSCHNNGWKGILLPSWEELPRSTQLHWMAAIAPLVDENNSFQERIRQSMKTTSK